MTKNSVKIFVGNMVHCRAKLKIEIMQNGFLAVLKNEIIAVGDASTLPSQLEQLEANYKIQTIYLRKSQILIPGLIDTHIHAPQYPNAGLGYDKTLLDWLDCYTFKLERQYKDLKFAKKVFDAIVKKTLQHGTTTACYFASLFTDASLVLVDSVIEYGQRALVGKVNMTLSPFSDYVETEEESFQNTLAFVNNVLSRKVDLVQPIITPRFALSCNLEHMSELGTIAKNNNLFVQTHISENVDEVAMVYETYGMSYAEVYDKSKLLTEKTILAHGIYLSDDELQLIAARKCSISHCPGSNTCLKSGLCDVRNILNYNIKMGLGTDVSGGPSPSICAAMRSALTTSVHLSFSEENYKPLTYTDVFYLATLGGAEALGLDNKIGNFRTGKEFDALIVDVDVDDTEVDYLLPCNPMEILQKFVYCGDDRNIVSVFVGGKLVKEGNTKFT
ncbi:hypothetical protein HUJ04_005184 [Dendroctonus ponderosae]|uniref:Guanine deaminase n=2 Tax=Dendroctonus ponderosae TaxID=77166 RepID=A0AAR5Q7W9_DENPD|nr:hypothetical protein HUJ04_005184 [Dendroctonus ponderosae]